MEKLPGEILSAVFIRLFVKQVGQIRCVCKSWNIILSESSFIKSHLRRSIHNNDEVLLFFNDGLPFECNPFTARPSRSPRSEIPNFIKLPIELPSKYTGVIGSVNGLICFYFGTHSNFSAYIWNPSLSAVLTVPIRSFRCRPFHLGFGFDPKTDDYKIVKFLHFHGAPEKDEIYSMRKGSWEFITERVPSHVIRVFDQDDVCVDGVDGHLHWLGDTDLKGKPQTIVAFDLGAETYGEIPLPDSVLHHRKDRFTNLGVLAGKLCGMAYIEIKHCYEVWVMDKHGVAESWVKHHVFPRFRGNIIPYGFTSHNNFLFQVNNYTDQFALYDRIADKTKYFEINGANTSITKVIEYVDSLVWITPAKIDCKFEDSLAGC